MKFFIVGGVHVENSVKNPCSEWLPANSWDEICRADEITAFKDIATNFKENEKKWKTVYDKFVEDFKIPSPWQETVSLFERLILIRILRPDKLLTCITNFIRSEMDERFVKPPPFNIAASYDESYCLAPLIFILSPGTDPMSTLVKYAADKKMSDKFKSISLGQGGFSTFNHLIQFTFSF